MVKPTSNTRERLLKTGKELVLKNGVSGLSLRDVAKKTKINLGMFSYCFKNKEDFVNIILDELHDEFLKDFVLTSQNKMEPIEALKEMLFSVGVFVRDNRKFMSAMAKDVAVADKIVMKFFKAKFNKHLFIFIKTLKECKDQKLIKDLPIHSLVVMLMTSVSFPIMLLDMFPLVSLEGLYLNITSKSVTSDKAIKERIDAILDGLIIK